MISKKSGLLLLFLLGLIQFELSLSQDVSSFLGELMKNYVAKNTRYYTIVNGVPVQESKDTPPDNSEILSRISAVLPDHIAHSPVLSQILDEDANSFPNSWTPMMSEAANSNAPPPSSRRQGSNLLPEYHFQWPQESKIITAEDIPHHFNIQSSMTF